eukprot:TRINITY_DN16128_c0_g1_i1.p1 TRINITY_DN16128_c0_g1~~TRINITY_DN16128_c0_g1_i1.p1  ORF type:complete len:263 (-),score=55.34 TRINITY_DN16128_c0_g1_i1:44-784(-)
MDRIQDPVRGDLCQHMQCFDLNGYLSTNNQMQAVNNRWKCPLCSLILRPQDLRRDLHFAEVLRVTSNQPDLEEVEVLENGAWRLPGGRENTSARSGSATASSSSGAVLGEGEQEAIAVVEDLVDLDASQEGATLHEVIETPEKTQPRNPQHQEPQQQQQQQQEQEQQRLQPQQQTEQQPHIAETEAAQAASSVATNSTSAGNSSSSSTAVAEQPQTASLGIDFAFAMSQVLGAPEGFSLYDYCCCS